MAAVLRRSGLKGKLCDLNTGEAPYLNPKVISSDGGCAAAASTVVNSTVLKHQASTPDAFEAMAAVLRRARSDDGIVLRKSNGQKTLPPPSVRFLTDWV